MTVPRTIYAIKHTVTKRIYIGSTSKPIKQRYYAHLSKLRNNKHSAKLMQEDYNKYGEKYEIYKLGVINSFEERFKEYEEMIKHNTFDKRFGYNQGDEERAKRILFMLREPVQIKEDLSDLDEH